MENNNQASTDIMSIKNAKLQIGNAYKNAWQHVKGVKGAYWGALIMYLIIMFVISIVVSLILGMFFITPDAKSAIIIASQTLQNTANQPSLAYMITNSIVETIVSLILSVLGLGIIYIGVKRMKELPIKAMLLFHIYQQRRFWAAIGLFILFGLIIYLIPFILSVIALMFDANWSNLTAPPYQAKIWSSLLFLIAIIYGIYFGMRLLPTLATFVDRKIGPAQAIKVTFSMTKGNFWRILGSIILATIIIIISAIPIGIGLIWSLPFYNNLIAEIYDQLGGIQTSEVSE